MISAVKPELIPVIWPIVKPMLEAPIKYSHNELCIDDMYDRLIKGEMLLLTINKKSEVVAAITCEKRDFPTGKTILNVTTAGGSALQDWFEDLDKVMDRVAKEYGCEEIYIVGRPGWVRVLKNVGYEKIHTVVSRKVGD